jgi:hypothetical protein
MVDSFKSAGDKEVEAANDLIETEQEEKLEDDFAEIVVEEAPPQLSFESASLSDGSQNGGAIMEKNRKTLLALELMLDRITRIRNEGMV